MIEGLGPLGLALSACIVFGAFVVRGMSGFGAAGYYSMDTLLLPVMGAGSWVGERLGNRVSQESFSKLMALLLLVAGVLRSK